MKILKAMEQIKATKPSQYSDEMMLGWISTLDGQVYSELLTHYGAPAPVLPYTMDRLGEELAVPFPFDDIYLIWMSAKIDQMNCEFERYNNEMLLFNSRIQEFYSAYTRTHTVMKPTIMKGVKAL